MQLTVRAHTFWEKYARCDVTIPLTTITHKLPGHILAWFIAGRKNGYCADFKVASKPRGEGLPSRSNKLCCWAIFKWCPQARYYFFILLACWSSVSELEYSASSRGAPRDLPWEIVTTRVPPQNSARRIHSARGIHIDLRLDVVRGDLLLGFVLIFIIYYVVVDYLHSTRNWRSEDVENWRSQDLENFRRRPSINLSYYPSNIHTFAWLLSASVRLLSSGWRVSSMRWRIGSPGRWSRPVSWSPKLSARPIASLTTDYK